MPSSTRKQAKTSSKKRKKSVNVKSGKGSGQRHHHHQPTPKNIRKQQAPPSTVTPEVSTPSNATQVTSTRQIAPTVTTEEGVTVTEYVHSYTESGTGVRVVKRITIKRIAPGSAHATPNGTATQGEPDAIEPSSLNDFKSAVLQRHNELRALHGCPPLTMSREMCYYAQEWADHLAHNDAHFHRPNRKYGENIFWKTSSTSMSITGAEAVDSWYEEISLYDRAWYGGDPPPGTFKESGHYTQLIWRATKRLGVGLALNGATFYVVANYDPHGNIITRYKDNVPQPLSWAQGEPSEQNNVAPAEDA